jgi:hypothetical protein
MNYIKNVVEIVVQLKRGDKGVRFISEVYFKPLDDMRIAARAKKRRLANR